MQLACKHTVNGWKSALQYLTLFTGARPTLLWTSVLGGLRFDIAVLVIA